jgi:phage replication-related protein YjqB (UPF0714/DUF867 family)
VSGASFAELLTMPGVVEECELRSSFGFMAYHGGALEPGTDVIARTAAERAGASYYGVLQPESLLVHIPSIRVGADQSSSLASFLDHVDTVITIHGYGRAPTKTAILLGGRNRDLATHVAGHLRAALPEYDIVDDLSRIPIELQGIHHRNPVNIPRFAGVQVELPPRARGAGPYWKDFDGDLVPHTRTLIGALVGAATTFETP